MAEFKIGRLRFTYAGVWATATVYKKDDVVSYNGKMYCCLTPHTANADFNVDLTASRLVLIIDGKTWKNAWTTSTYYDVANIVSFNNAVYICTVAHTSAGAAIDLAKFTTLTTFVNWTNTWATGTVYKVGNIVKYGGIVYVCNTDHTSVAASLTLSATGVTGNGATITFTFATQTAAPFVPQQTITVTGVDPGAYNTTFTVTSCTVSSVVVAGATTTAYVSGGSIVGSNIGNLSGLEMDTAKWDYIHKGIEFKGEYAGGVRYKLNDVVRIGASTYICTVTHTSNIIPIPDLAKFTTYVEGLSYANAWASGNTYQSGDVVTYGGYSYLSLSYNNTNNNPVTSTANWSIFNQSFSMQGTWGAGTAYLVGAVVRRGANLFVAVADNSAQDPLGYSVTPTFTLAGSSGVTVKVSSTTGVNTGMIVTGEGFDRGQTVLAVVNATTLTLDQAPDGATVDGGTLTITGPNPAYWNTIAPSVSYLGFWTSGTTYLIGDLVIRGNATYRCIRDHNTDQRPDLDTVNSYWAIYTLHTRKNALTLQGDLLTTTNGSTYTTLPIGVNQYTLTSTGSAINWNKMYTTSQVFYVAPNGVDNSAIYGRTWDQPFASVAYAAGIVKAGLMYTAQGTNLTLNREFLAQETYYWMLSQKAASANGFTPSSVFGQTRALTYARYAVDAIAYDLARGGNSQTVATALYYFASSTAFINATVIAEMPYTIASLTYLGTLINTVLGSPGSLSSTYQTANNVASPVTYVQSGTAVTAATTMAGVLMSYITTALTNVSTAALPAPNSGATSSILVKTGTYDETLPIVIPANCAVIGDELRSTVIRPKIRIDTVATGTSASGNNIYVSNTAGMYVNCPVQFISSDNNSPLPLVAFESSNIVQGTTYYVISYTNTTIQVSSSLFGGPIALTGNGAGLMRIVGGDALKNMFLVRNGAGLRNMTLSGLLGTLTTQNQYLTSRPTGGAYVSLDPGTGTNDTSAWIYRKSPYVQNVSTFGQGCTGVKIDGTLHAGGNKSIVVNDYTQILSDGIGIWCTGSNALIEAVSMFSYYAHIGYLAEAGGKIRATNGNSSYGTYGVVAEGYDASETPITGNIYNQNNQLSVTPAFVRNTTLWRYSYTNAGSNYTVPVTNLINYSNNFLGASWTVDNLTLLQNTASPTGYADAWLLTGTSASTATGFVSQSTAINATGAIFSAISANSTTGGGSGATFDVTVSPTGYVVTLVAGGTGYTTSSVLTFNGSVFGGITGTNDLTVRVTSVTSGAIGALGFTAGGAVIYVVTIVGPTSPDTGNKYALNGVYRPTPTWVVGYTYVFNQNSLDNVYWPNANGTTPNAHPLNFSADNLNGANGGGTSYLNNVTYYLNELVVTQTQYNSVDFNTATTRRVEILITPATPATLYYWCWNHSNMGNSATVSNPSGGIIGGTVPSGTLQNYTVSAYVKQGTAASVDLYTTFSGSSSRTSSINYNFNTNTVTPASASSGFLPTSYGAQNVNNGWIRIWFTTYDTSALNTALQYRLYVKGYSTASTGYSYVYGAQIENTGSLGFYLTNLTTTRYTAYADYIVSGSGSGVITIGDESRSLAVFETRMTDTGFGVGGQNYITSSNAAQTGTTLSVTLAAADVLLPTNYIGMRLSLIGGTGIGQFGYISSYNSTSKIATIVKESFTPALITATTTGVFNLDNSVDLTSLYLNQPVQFLPNYYNTSVTASSQDTVTVTASTGGQTNTFTVNSTAPLTVAMPIMFSGAVFGGVISNFTYYVTNIIDATTIQVSTKVYGTTLFLNTSGGNMLINYGSNTSHLTGSTTNMIATQPIQFTGTALGGISASSIYYINDIVSGSQFTISSALVSLTVTATTVSTDPTRSNQLTVNNASAMTPCNPIIFSGTTFGNIVNGTRYYISNIPDGTHITVSSTIVRVVATSCSTSEFTVSSTTGFVVGNPIIFGGNTFGGITKETTYYVQAINGNGTAFSVSQTAGGSAVVLTAATGYMQIRTTPASFTLITASGSMSGSSTTGKYTLTSAAGTMSAVFQSSLIGGISQGTTYYVYAINSGSPNSFSITATSGGASAITLTAGTGSMQAVEAGWDNINSGWPILNTLDTTTLYFIEPRLTYTAPPFTQASSTLPTQGTAYTAMAYGNGTWLAVGTSSNVLARSIDGVTWTSTIMPTSAAWTGIAYGAGYWVTVASGGTTAQYSNGNGQSWKSAALPSSATWTDIAYGNGTFVAIATNGSTVAYSTNFGASWSAGTSLPGAPWKAICYGAGTFVAVASNGPPGAAYSTDGISWTGVQLPGDPKPWSSVAYGNGRFVAVSSTNGPAVYSFDGATWYESLYSVAASKIAYGQGVFVALAQNNTTGYTTEDGQRWKTRTVTSSAYAAIAFGFKSNNIGTFVTAAGTTTGSVIGAGATARAKPNVTSGGVAIVNMVEPGSNYTSTPAITLFDPNLTVAATSQIRIGNGALSNPTFVNRGSGYSTATTYINTVGTGYADSYQFGLFIYLNNISRLPRAGDDLTISGDNEIYKVTSVVVLNGSVAPNITAYVGISPAILPAISPAQGTSIIIRQLYSQVRLTGHDFLNIGYGDQLQSNYPGTPTTTALATQKQAQEANYGRVFYTATDQDGNFTVGDLFGVQQSTGIVTISASQFGLTGLSALSLGGIAVGSSSVVINLFSTDPTFVANADNIIPTQKATKSYITSRLSQGGANTVTNNATAGTVSVGGTNIIISTLTSNSVGSTINMPKTINFNGATGGIDGNMMAAAFFYKHFHRR